MQMQNVEFTRGKETKNTHRYEAPPNAEVQGSLYIPKSATGPNPPDTIVVSVSTTIQGTGPGRD